MEVITQFLNQGLGYIVPLIILLGLLVFVHELGHFLAAKFFGVRVETFSLGFGPQILKYVKGPTTYCISAIPLGGYVKMFGDIYGADVPESEKKHSYLHKPVFQRIIIAFAGPLMNLLFAILLFWNIALIGTNLPSNKIGFIFENSTAHKAGLRSYDEIVSINGSTIGFWNQVQDSFNLEKNKTVSLEVQRNDKSLTLSIPIETEKNPNSLSGTDEIGTISGLSNHIHFPYVGIDKGSVLDTLGLTSGDKITHIGEQPIKYFYEIIENLKTANYPLTIKYERVNDLSDRKEKPVEKSVLLTNPPNYDKIGLFIPETIIVNVVKDSPADKTGLQIKDRITSINGNAILSFQDIVANISSFKKSDPPLAISIVRDGMPLNLTMSPIPTDLEDQFGVKESRPTIGINPLVAKGPELKLWKAKTFSDSMTYAITKTKDWTEMIFMGLVHMIKGKVATKNIGGIFSIGAAASYSWSKGATDFLKMMAIISINLFILNLLPVPILDGGHLVLFFLEALKGAPLSLKKVELAHQIGFLFVLALMAFALFNDFTRMFGSPS